MANPNATFAIGQVVRLKSGGPEMTVIENRPNSEVVCTWFSPQKGIYDRIVIITAALDEAIPRL